MNRGRLLQALALAPCLWSLGCKPVPTALVASPSVSPSAVIQAAPTPSATAGLYSELAIDGPLDVRVSRAPADLVLYYGSEQKGSMETCGCPHRPRGSLARTASYVAASRAASPAPSLLVNAGAWLTDAVGFQNMPMPQLAVMDRTMAEGILQGGWDVLNVTPRDLAGLPGVKPADLARLPMVSANIEGPHIVPYRLFTVGGRTVAVTGVAEPEVTLSDLAGYTVHPVSDALPVLHSIAEKADAIVLLSYGSAAPVRTLAQREPKIVTVIDAAGHNQYVEPFYVKNAVWALSFVQTMRLGELRLSFGPDNRVQSALDRHIDLDPEVPDEPILLGMQQRARTAIDAASGAP